MLNILRLLIPARWRITVGVWLINRASCCWFILKLYLNILHGKVPSGMGIEGNYCYCDYHGSRIRAPKNAAGVFLEIFQDKVYEQYWSPQPGDTVLDIGAYVGMFTVKAACDVGNNGRVIAVEPSRKTFKQLMDNCSSFNNVILVNKAAMNHTGKGKLYSSASAAANSMMTSRKEYETVEVDTIDNLLSELGIDKVNFVKIDAEGGELEVLKGATRLLQGGAKLAIAAYHTVPYSGKEVKIVRQYLEKAGYIVYAQKGLRSYLHAEKTN